MCPREYSQVGAVFFATQTHTFDTAHNNYTMCIYPEFSLFSSVDFVKFIYFVSSVFLSFFFSRKFMLPIGEIKMKI